MSNKWESRNPLSVFVCQCPLLYFTFPHSNNTGANDVFRVLDVDRLNVCEMFRRQQLRCIAAADTLSVRCHKPSHTHTHTTKCSNLHSSCDTKFDL